MRPRNRPGAILGLASALILAGCVQAPKAWTRVDGLSVVPERLQADTVGCKGQVEKAAIQGQARSTVDMPLGMDRADSRVFLGCMAEKGYLPQ